MTADELLIWQARNRESPIGLERHDFPAPQVSSAIGRGKISDLLPRWGQDASDGDAIDNLMGGE